MVQSHTTSRAVWSAVVLLGCASVALAYWQPDLIPARSAHANQGIVLLSEFPIEQELGDSLLREISLVQTDVITLLQLPQDSRRVTVHLFASRETYLEYVQKHYPEAVDRNALFVHENNESRVLVYQHSELLNDLRHECTHAVLHNVYESLPLWLDEGLAEYFEVAQSDRTEGNPYLPELKSLIESDWKPNLAHLEGLKSLREITRDDYRESWAWTHFLIHGEGQVRQVLHDHLLESRGNHKKSQLSGRLQACFADPEIELISHLTNW
ncbi:hypothetical protein [Planctomicrobium sp. SH527]|uniref:hypothetical protein n=1 Tax=Planctomicrobium sp. SH527 TaxID=3448123 RepID=UPI003F5B5EEA